MALTMLMGMDDPRWAAFSERDRQALLRKYRQLVAWRQARDRDAEGSLDRAALRALAVEFPGALRELDTLGVDEIERRVGRLEAQVLRPPAGDDVRGSVDGDALPQPDRWMAWIAAYHRWMRAALVVKAGLAGRHRVDDALKRALMEAAGLAAGAPVDNAFIDEVASPPQGRLSRVVLARVAGTFAMPVAQLAQALFPARRAKSSET